MPDNFYGNDPNLGIIRAGDQKYSLPDSERDASSSGNTFQVGTGPQPGLPAGRFLPGEIAGALRNQERASAAAARAAQPPPPPVSPTPIAGSTFTAGSAVPVQTTLPNPVTPVAVPTFVPSTGLPNFGSSNLLAQTSVPGAAGGLSNVPNIGSPLQPLLATGSTPPATGTSIPNIGSNLGSQSVFTQLFPSVPDISQQPIATAADGGPILASDSLPRYEDGGEAEKALRSEILTELMKFLVEGGSWTPEEFYNEFGNMPTHKLKYELEVQRRYPLPQEGKPYVPPWEGENPPPEIAPWPEESVEGPTELDYDMSLPERFRSAPYSFPSIHPDRFSPLPPGPLGERQAANGGPILASEYLNAGGPVQYFWTGGESITDADVADVAAQEADAVNAALDEAGLTEGFKGRLPNPIKQGRFSTPDPTAAQVLGGRFLTAPDAAALTPEQVATLTDAQVRGILNNQAVLNAVPPSAFASEKAAAAQNLINPKNTEVNFAVQNELQNPVTGKGFAQGLFNQNNLTGFFVNPQTVGQGFLTQAEGGPVLASERLNAGGPVQYFNEGQGVNAPAFPGEGEYGPVGSAVDYSGQVSVATPDGQAAGPAADQSKDQSRSLTDTAITYGTSALKSGAAAAALSPFGILGSFITTPMMANSFFTGMRNAQEGLDVESKNLAEAAGKFANQKLGLALSKNQAYPGDYGYGLDPDKDYSGQTAFSPTISRYSSDFDVDDPLQGGQ